MVNTPSDAVPWVMAELGYEWKKNCQCVIGKTIHSCIKGYCNKNVPLGVMNELQAFQHCRSLDVLSEVWTKKHWSIGADFHAVTCFNIVWDMKIIGQSDDIDCKTAALVATGRVLEARHG